MKWNLLLALPLLCALNGCIALDCGYSPNDDVQAYSPSRTKKFPITYSVTLDYVHPEADYICGPTLSGMRDKVHDALVATGLFSTISYATSPTNGSYHLAFAFHHEGLTLEEGVVLGNLAGATLLIIPVLDQAGFDGEVTLYHRAKAIYSSGAAEKINFPIWLPLAPIGIFMNCPVGWHYTEKGVVNNLVNDVAKFHYQQFVKQPVESKHD